jgi:hypothetical protein
VKRLLLLSAVTLALPATASSSTIPLCQDGKDNDKDGVVDSQDSGCKTPLDYTEGKMTRGQARSYVVNDLFGRFYPARRIRVSCGTGPRYRCRWRLRSRSYAYRGSMSGFDAATDTNDDGVNDGEIPTTRMNWFIGSCGTVVFGFVRRIRVKSLSCGTAKQYIRNWYAGGKEMPSSFSCRLRSLPGSARCEADGKAFTFQYPE